MIEEQTVQLVQQSLTGITDRQINTVLNLMQEGNTVPFIARYRKEMTGSLDEVQIQAIEEAYKRATALQDRKAALNHSPNGCLLFQTDLLSRKPRSTLIQPKKLPPSRMF